MLSRMDRPTTPLSEAARQRLRQGPQSARELMDAFEVSQPTVSRALRSLGDDLIPIGAARSIQYGLLDRRRVALQAPVFRVLDSGQIQPLGQLIPVHPEGFVMQGMDAPALHSDGLPWWLYDMRPQGYLGRAYNQRHGTRLGLPERLSDWSDTDVLRALLLQGSDLPGNLLLGSEALQQFVNAPPPVPIDTADKPRRYAELSAAAAQGEMPGSSAAGEQPKFTTYAQRDDGTGPAHVIVKFSAPVPGPVSQRWRDLLWAEHLALQVLSEHGVCAAASTVIDHDGQRFLEVQRFDRVGARGRHALFSLAALDAEFAGQPGRWPDTARALARAKVIEAAALPDIERLWAFGTLIGNTDMHAGNLSFMSDSGRPYALAPAYDMTPMAFAPGAGGDLTLKPLTLNIADQVSAQAWHQALALAETYVQRLAQAPLSPSFAPCLAALQNHVAQARPRIEPLL